MQLANDIVLITISILHLIVASSLGYVSFLFWQKCRQGHNGITRGMLLVFVSFFAAWIWSVLIVLSQYLGVETQTLGWRVARLITITMIVSSLVYLSVELFALPDPEQPEADEPDATD